MAKKTAESQKLQKALLDTRSTFLPELEAARQRIAEQTKEAESLLNFADNLYDEIDKLSKKAPAEPLTDLALQQINDAIREARALGSEDNTLRRVKEFVAAGDNPQHRDAVIVLRLVRAGLDEVHKRLERDMKGCAGQLNDARALEAALEAVVEGETAMEDVDREFFRYYRLSPSDFWQIENDIDQDDYRFNFARLDEINLASHFTFIRS